MGKEMYTTFLIKYSEIFTKGKNRHLFEDALAHRVAIALKPCEGRFQVTRTPARIYAEAQTEFDYDEVITALKRVFGIVYICPVVKFEDQGFEKLGEDVTGYLRQVYGNEKKTFKVFAKRARKNYPIPSMEINSKLGGVVLDAFPNMKVDVHNPDFMLHVEVREHIYVYSESIPGPGGMPIGTAGKGMLLLSGGIDSPVAGYMIARRGVEIDAVYFHAPPYTSDRAKQKVVDLAAKISLYCGQIKLHIVNFTDIQLAIYERCPHEELTIIMRRLMMRIAERIAKESNCLGLITGESIGQVASQTMKSLMATNEVCTLPVYRPLIAFDKQDIVEISEKIDTYETSILPFEDCCTIFVAEHPVTKPELSVIKKHEEALNDVINEMIETALSTREVVRINALL